MIKVSLVYANVVGGRTYTDSLGGLVDADELGSLVDAEESAAGVDTDLLAVALVLCKRHRTTFSSISMESERLHK
jgi:hypothetical protein